MAEFAEIIVITACIGLVIEMLSASQKNEKKPEKTNHVAFACMLLIPLLFFALVFFIH